MVLVARNPATAGMTIAVALAAIALWLVLGNQSDLRDQQRQLTAQAAAFQRANVQARFEDCLSSESLRAALRAEVLAGKRTNPLLFKLLPSLDTPHVHRLVRQERRQELHAFRPLNCRAFALETVPPGQRAQYDELLDTLSPPRSP